MNILSDSKTIIGVAAAAIALVSGCAKEVKTDTSNVNQEFMEAWMKSRHPGTSPTGLGVYILEDIPGSGTAVTDDDMYLFAEYTSTDLEGNVSQTTKEKTSQQIGSFSAANYYGPRVLINSKSFTETGILETIRGMRVGGTRKAVIPGWLNATQDYATAEEYLKNSSGANIICTIRIVDKTTDITAWEVDTLQRYVARNMNSVDSTKFGYYVRTVKEPTKTEKFSIDTTFYINYTGRLLNGHVFDSTIEDTAKVHGIWSSGRKYAPTKVTMDEEYTKITIGADDSSEGSTVIDGFSYCLSNLRPYEKVICAFNSQKGYGYNGKGSTIPPFAPLVYEIEVVDEP